MGKVARKQHYRGHKELGTHLSTHSGYPYSPRISKVTMQRSTVLRNYSGTDLKAMFERLRQYNNGAPRSVTSRTAESLKRLLFRFLQLQPAQPASPPRRSPKGSRPQSQELTVVAQEPGSRFKRLGPVVKISYWYLNLSYALALSVYATTRALVVPSWPAFFSKGVQRVENRVSAIGSPIINAVQHQSDRVVVALDTKTDNVITAVFGFCTYTGDAVDRALVQPAVDSVHRLSAAKDAYLERVEAAVCFVKEKGVSGTAQAAVEQVLAAVQRVQRIPPYLEGEAKALMLKVGDAWQKLIRLPPVNLMVAAARPGVDFAWHRYLEAHDAVVCSTTYTKAVEAGAHKLGKVQDSFVFRKLHPLVAPLTDPAINLVTDTDYFQALTDHFRPAAVITKG